MALFTAGTIITADVDTTGDCDREGDILTKELDDRCISMNCVGLCSSWLAEDVTRGDGLGWMTPSEPDIYGDAVGWIRNPDIDAIIEVVWITDDEWFAIGSLLVGNIVAGWVRLPLDWTLETDKDWLWSRMDLDIDINCDRSLESLWDTDDNVTWLADEGKTEFDPAWLDCI